MEDSDMAKTGVAVIASLILLCSCTRTVYEPVERVHIEYMAADTAAIYNHLKSFFESQRLRETASDSLIERTKETVVINDIGDTTRHDRERTIYRAKDSGTELHIKIESQDSTITALRLQLASVKSDSIPVPYPVEKQLTKWQQTKMDFGGIAIGAVIAVVCVAVVWLIRKFRK